MRQVLLAILLPVFAFAQKEVKPTIVKELDLSATGEAKFDEQAKALRKVLDKIESGVKPADLSATEKKIWDSEGPDVGYWQTIGAECSWYCGGVIDTVYASSSLKSQEANNYSASNAHDYDLKNAWVEGVKGSGIGEYLKYEFPADCPRITTIIIANGYVKSEQAYRDNSRVKKLKMYVNDKPFAILDLEDKRSQQYFKFAPIGNGDRSSREALLKQGPWSLKFEILEVYKGARYDDVVISELYFDGIDVH